MDRRIAVVGLGAMGSAIAHQLAERNATVVGFDAHEPPHTLGSSHGHGRIIREAFFEGGAYVPLVRRAYELWAALEARAGTPLFHPSGGLFFGPEEGQLVAGILEAARRFDVAHEQLTPSEAAQRFPALRVPEHHVAVHEPRAGVLDPEASVRAQLEAARAAGALLHTHTAVTGWRAHDAGVTVTTAGDEIEADALVLAAGPWLASLVADLALPLIVERYVQAHFAPPGDGAAHRAGAMPVFGVEHEPDKLFYGLPDTGHGVKVGLHQGGPTVTPDEVDREVSGTDLEPLAALTAHFVPGIGAPTDASVCLYTSTPDRQFLVDRHPEHEDVFLVSPCSGHGFKFAPAIGEAVAELVLEGTSRQDLGAFGVGRFQR